MEQTAAPAPTPAPVSPSTVPGLASRHLQRLQAAAGNSAVSRLVAQRYAAPVKPPPSQAPGFRKVQSDVAAKKRKLAQHNPAAAESRSAQDAAVAPPDDKEAQGKAANAEKMNAAKPGEFDKAGFIAAVNEAIAAQAPKNLDEADKFADSGKADKIKGEVDGKVTDGKNASSKDIETTTKAAPDTSQAKEKEVTPMKPDQPPANPGAPNAADATPQQQPPEVTDFSEGPKKTDQQMADADVTEEQLAKSNEPEFTAALGEKKKAEQHSETAPGQARAAEKQQLATAKSHAAGAGTQAMSALTAARAGAGKQVDGGKGETKSKDEQKREEVTAKLQKVFDAAKKDVEGILEGLDGKVDKQFEEGEKKARDAFNKDQKRRMKEYKDKRYGGFWGPAKWAKDKIAGMPEEANRLFQESRKLYVNQMQGVISSIADTIGTELGKAKTRIAKGRAELKAEVDKLPADLKKYGQDAAKDFAGKFDDLESEVNDKSKELVQTLAQKYTQALNAVDEEIKKLQEANKGLVQKAVDAVVGVIKTINDLKNLLMGILAKAASAIMKIIKDPIGFLGNLVRSVGAGLQQFMSNIGTHLQTGLVSWLLGTSVKAGIEIPAKFDLKGIIQLIASLLGLTWANIRARITRKGVPDQAMSKAEQSVPVAKALATEGPAGAAKEITAETGDLKSTILEELKSYLIPTVIIAGITWILSLLNPASAFVRAAKAIIDIVSFVVNQGAQIVDFVNAVLDAVIAIANGGAAGVPKTIETALAASIPLLIGLLASLLGIGGLANKIKQVFQKVSRPVNRAIDKIVEFISKKGKSLWRKSKRKYKDQKAGGENNSDQAPKNPQNRSYRKRAAVADADRLLNNSRTHEDARSSVSRASKRHNVPLTLVVESRERQSVSVHVQAIDGETHRLSAQNQQDQALNTDRYTSEQLASTGIIATIYGVELLKCRLGKHHFVGDRVGTFRNSQGRLCETKNGRIKFVYDDNPPVSDELKHRKTVDPSTGETYPSSETAPDGSDMAKKVKERNAAIKERDRIWREELEPIAASLRIKVDPKTLGSKKLDNFKIEALDNQASPQDLEKLMRAGNSYIAARTKVANIGEEMGGLAGNFAEKKEFPNATRLTLDTVGKSGRSDRMLIEGSMLILLEDKGPQAGTGKRRVGDAREYAEQGSPEYAREMIEIDPLLAEAVNDPVVYSQVENILKNNGTVRYRMIKANADGSVTAIDFILEKERFKQSSIKLPGRH
ncbi:HPC2 multi-domain protein [Streptomyces sp. 8ZJF_21]|uniref:HPC2 multi-domain protein n=1 Tax=Streptomyces sp. 8ZJF_21 TaxID=2903141 RepID=UPI001E52EE89|nr:HPC2 multi-domain protein [Streptomyces sp. 8ZJF_21]MCD9590082.1 HPC2 multi-domain protein [Streptomyces sp. 8ZJF_21]